MSRNFADLRVNIHFSYNPENKKSVPVAELIFLYVTNHYKLVHAGYEKEMTLEDFRINSTLEGIEDLISKLAAIKKDIESIKEIEIEIANPD